VKDGNHRCRPIRPLITSGDVEQHSDQSKQRHRDGLDAQLPPGDFADGLFTRNLISFLLRAETIERLLDQSATGVHL
jgi:hypothetical protein